MIFFGVKTVVPSSTPKMRKSHKKLARAYAYTRAIFFLLFVILSVEEGTTLLTPKKITVFPGTTKVGPICPTFIRGDPYEPHRAHEKVTFSDH